MWGVSESGLGGFLHALKIPFSGLFLGSFAVIIVTFIALTSESRFRTILQATLIVLFIKAVASPHSPPAAYIAVLFQGFLGAMIYQVFKVNRISAIIFGVLALMESALQKLLMMVLIFGNNIWVAFQEFFAGITKQFHIKSLEEIPVIIVGTYLFLYFLFGIIAGIIAIKLPGILQQEFQKIQLESLPNPETISYSRRQQNKTKIITFVLVLLFIVSVFVISGSLHKALYSVLRTFAALVILQFIVRPLFNYFLKRWKKKQQSSQNKPLQEVLEFLPEYRKHAKIAFKMAENESSIFKKLRQFVLIWMCLSLYYEK